MTAYSPLITPGSMVGLGVLGRENENPQLKITAKTTIPAGTVIPELVGRMANDEHVEGATQELSIISSMSAQFWVKAVPRVLVGPARFINHSCDPNAEFLAVKKTDAFIVYALRVIKKGEEITVHYGADWFKDAAIKCWCLKCK